MPKDSKVHQGTKAAPKYGYRPCESCGIDIPLCILRDVTRKRFCSRTCRSSWVMNRILLPHGKTINQLPVELQVAARKKQSASMAKWLREHQHPMVGKRHTKKAKLAIAAAQQKRYADNPRAFASRGRHGNWNGGIKLCRGYIMQLCPGHHRANGDGYVRQHILIAEQTLGRNIRRGEVVHHVNGDKSDNRPENLCVLPSQADHVRLHAAQRKVTKEKTNAS